MNLSLPRSQTLVFCFVIFIKDGNFQMYWLGMLHFWLKLIVENERLCVMIQVQESEVVNVLRWPGQKKLLVMG